MYCSYRAVHHGMMHLGRKDYRQGNRKALPNVERFGPYFVAYFLVVGYSNLQTYFYDWQEYALKLLFINFLQLDDTELGLLLKSHVLAVAHPCH